MNSLDELRRMAIFASVVEAQSFTAAAERLGMAKSAVSRQVSLLEEHIGAPLLARTTRRLSLTETGESFYERAARMVAEAEAGLAEVRGQLAKPTGLLRVSAPHELGHAQIAPAVHEFRLRYPEVEVELLLEDSYVDLVADKIDVAVRAGHLKDSSLIARKLASSAAAICASPQLVAERGLPSDHTALADWDWIIYTLSRTPKQLRLVAPDGRAVTVRMSGPIRTNSGAATRVLVRAGAGLSPLPRFYVEDDLASGRLVQLLPDYRIDVGHIHAVFLPGRDLLPKVRLFVDFLATRLQQCC